ncbi:virulence protein RhuM/Fic/DOC family protein [Candidatus Saccharibacteria bacterium]|nr:virulence protein RhuM/Fic/DOC family protein [Candidatus Saccharibacteria bacterium]MBQ1540293.1 virulence protein RhuM/Fic/DOC family protein [Candidatus Saccharibacteria bacterium]
MEGEKRIEIYEGLRGEVVFDVDTEGETIWATQAQITDLFGVDRTVITRHLNNIFKDGELDEKRVCAKNAHTGPDGKTYQVKMYNLDAIISVGYRVNSKKATQFRVWATSVLRKYLVSGVAVNQKRLETLAEKKEIRKLHDVEEMMGIVRRLTARLELDAGEANGVLEVISRYAGSFKTLAEYDDGRIDLRFMNRAKKGRELTVEMCDKAVAQLRKSVHGSDLFGKKRGGGFDGSIAAIFQSFDGEELYRSVPEKAAHLLYFVIKDHPFYDGNKRIGALLFVLFLTMNNYHLAANGETKISDRALTALALLIAESEPKEKDLIVSLVCKLLE